MMANPFQRPPMIDFDHPAGQSLFWRISNAMDRLVEQLENHSPAELFFQKVDRDIAAAERALAAARREPVKVHHSAGCALCRSTDAHTHTRADWEAHIGGDNGRGADDLPPAAKPYVPPKKPPPDIHDLRRGRWYDEKPITTTNNGSTGGTGVSSLEETQAGMMAAIEKMNEGLGAVQQAHACLEEAQGMWMHAAEGSGQADVSEVNGLLAQAINDQEQVRQQVPAAISGAEGVANRL